MRISPADQIIDLRNTVRRSAQSVNALLGTGEPMRTPDRHTLAFSTPSTDDALHATALLRDQLAQHVADRRVLVSPAGASVIVTISEHLFV